jgi:hypothetical protein
MLNSQKKAPRERGVNPGSAAWCEHDKPILVNNTQSGSYYGRCLGCLAIGPESKDTDAARRALIGLGAKQREHLQRPRRSVIG